MSLTDGILSHVFHPPCLNPLGVCIQTCFTKFRINHLSDVYTGSNQTPLFSDIRASTDTCTCLCHSIYCPLLETIFCLLCPHPTPTLNSKFLRTQILPYLHLYLHCLSVPRMQETDTQSVFLE